MTNPNSAAQAATQHPIDEAIGLLTAEAESIRECHTPGCDRNDWTGESEAKAAHDNMMRVAAALSRLRAPVAREAVTWAAVRQELAIFLMGATGRSSKEWHRPLDNASEGGALAKMRACLAAPQASESDFAKLQSAYVGACDQIAELLAEKQARGGENHV